MQIHLNERMRLSLTLYLRLSVMCIRKGYHFLVCNNFKRVCGALFGKLAPWQRIQVPMTGDF